MTAHVTTIDVEPWENGPPPGRFPDDEPQSTREIRAVNEMREELPAKAEKIDPCDPLATLPGLRSVAVMGRTRILELASTPVAYVWQDIAVGGTIILLAGAPGDGKTTLLFLILAARANDGAPVKLLARNVVPAPAGTFLVVIEGEHADASACRKLVRSLELLEIEETALDRVILIARKAVLVGSSEWLEVKALIAAGLVSDLAIDTVARVMPADGSSEQEQVALFDQVAKAIDVAPTAETRPIVWAVAHTRKNGQTGELADVSGSAQRTGQADSVLLLRAERADGRVVATRVTFAKLREDPPDYPMPLSFSITRETDGTSRVVVAQLGDNDDRPLETRIVEQLHQGPKTKNALAGMLGRNASDVDAAISNLFSAHTIRSTSVAVRGVQRKAFALVADGRRGAPNLTRLSPDSTPPKSDPTTHPTNS